MPISKNNKGEVTGYLETYIGQRARTVYDHYDNSQKQRFAGH